MAQSYRFDQGYDIPQGYQFESDARYADCIETQRVPSPLCAATAHEALLRRAILYPDSIAKKCKREYKGETVNNYKPLNIGLIGCGYQGQWLARAATALDGFVVTACTDPDETAVASVRAIAEQTEVEQSAASLIARADLDAVLIATPHHLLQPYALRAAAAGKHILAEKPIALNAEEAAVLETSVAENDVIYMAGYSFRYFPPVAEAKHLITDGVIGEIQTISAGMPKPGIHPGWTADPDAGGGILGFYGCHMVDRVLWFVEDRPVEVTAMVRYHPEYGVDVTSLFQVRFEQGAVAQFNIGGTSAGWFDFAHVCGRDGHLYLAADLMPHYVLTVSSSTREEYSRPQTSTLDLDRPAAIQQKMEAELTDFATAVHEHHQPPITVSDGRTVLEILDAVLESGQLEKPVAIGH